MISLFYIAHLVSVSSLPIELLHKRNVDQSLVSFGTSPNHYWLTNCNVKSGDLENDNFCDRVKADGKTQEGMLAMPKTQGEIDAITAMLAAHPVSFSGHDATWGGKYAWLGGKKWPGAGDTFSWFDGSSVGYTNWDTNQPQSTGVDASSLSYQPHLGLVRAAGSDQGKWHDFHGKDQGTNGAEATTGQVAVCQERPEYWLSAAGVPSDVLREELLSGGKDFCSFGELAMPKSTVEQTRSCTALATLRTDTGTAWDGRYVWLGGYRREGTNEIWRWNDMTPIRMSGNSAMNSSNWDNTNGMKEPGHDESSKHRGGQQRFFGLKRSNCKWHDFNGEWSESTHGQLALCQGYRRA